MIGVMQKEAGARTRKKSIIDEEIQAFARRLRAAVGDIPQAELIQAMKESGYKRMTQPRLSHYLHGRNYPDPPALIAFAQALGVSADYLLGLTDEPEPVNELVEKIATAKGAGKAETLLAQLSKEQRQMVLTFAEYLRSQSASAAADTSGAKAAEEGIESAMNAITRKYGRVVADDLIDTLAASLPDLAALIGPTSPNHHKRM